MSASVIIKKKGKCLYNDTFEAMQEFTLHRHAGTPDELWFLEHYPVFTQGYAGKPEHILAARDIPVVQTNRGGQVTYHGLGQLVGYLLIDLKRLKMGIRSFVSAIEMAIIQMLHRYQIDAYAKQEAPGVYTQDAKICSIGLKVQRGCTYHGLALNVDMDLSPFSFINPCGFKNLKMTQIRDFVPSVSLSQVSDELCHQLLLNLGYSETEVIDES